MLFSSVYLHVHETNTSSLSCAAQSLCAKVLMGSGALLLVRSHPSLCAKSWNVFLGQIVMDEHQRPNGIPVTRFTLQSIYAQSDDEKLEFEYESGNTNILVRCLILIITYLNI